MPRATPERPGFSRETLEAADLGTKEDQDSGGGP
jgi:hypothetical protein